MKNSNSDIWNPFIPTEKDLSRANELAQKNLILTGVLTFIFFPAGLIYLNRAINPLKIFGYTFILTMVLGLGGSSRTKQGFIDFVYFLGISAMTVEQVMTVKSASKRLGGGNISLSNSILGNSQEYSRGYTTDDKAVELLKELKKKYEANEISEDEFNLQKQQILESI
jgi:hypothetical protein